jgi:hypothetical protein
MRFSDSQVRQAISLQRKADEISTRMCSIIGRRVTCPEFLADRDHLRRQWLALPSDQQPTFPLRRIGKILTKPSDVRTKQTKIRVTTFLQQLGEFCAKWCILALVTWDLIEPAGPMWPELRPAAGCIPDYAFTLSTPPDFPLLTDDGLGRLASEHQDHIVRKQNVADLGRWQTYGLLFEIDHWERVVQIRYKNRKRERGFMRTLEQMVGDILHKDQTHVQKLRKKLHALRRSERAALPRL